MGADELARHPSVGIKRPYDEVMAGGRDYEVQRLAELILYAAGRLLRDVHNGATKLNKVCFFADFEAFRRTGRSITGAVYHHLPQGPCPHQFLPALYSLPEGDDWVWRRTDDHGHQARQLIPLRPARVDLFTGTEVAIIEEAIDLVWGLTNTQAADLSHETVAWRITGPRDEIPYGTAVLSVDRPTAEDDEWAEEMAIRAGLGTSPR